MGDFLQELSAISPGMRERVEKFKTATDETMMIYYGEEVRVDEWEHEARAVGADAVHEAGGARAR